MKHFVSRVKRTSGNIEKGTEVHDTRDSAMQSVCAYMGAYAYGHDSNTDYVQVNVRDVYNTEVESGCMVWIAEGVNPDTI